MHYIIYNAIKTPDSTVLECKHPHDYQTHIDAVSGEVYMNDGLGYYARRSVNKVPYEDLSVTTEDAFEKQRECFTWGTRGKTGTEELRRVALKEMETEHIKAILNTQKHIKGTYVEDLLKKELNFRKLARLRLETE